MEVFQPFWDMRLGSQLYIFAANVFGSFIMYNRRSYEYCWGL